jgi:DNA-binding response OmpR family regulator
MTKLSQDNFHPPVQLLLICSDQDSKELLQVMLQEEGFQLTFVKNAEAAKDTIFAKPASFYSAYLFNDHQQTLQNLELLRILKADSRYAIVPAIFQIDSRDSRDIQMGLENGAYFYLIKPFTKSLLLSVLTAAVKGFTHHQELTRRMADIEKTRTMIDQAQFHIRTFEDAKSLSSVLAYIAPNPKETGVGLFELMVNAIEHGNLKISYQEKTRLLQQDTFRSEVQKRLAQPENLTKMATVIFNRTPKQLSFTVIDTGEGFDYRPFLDFSIERAMDNHGRGIMIANKLSFDELEYQNNGSKVTGRINLN